MGSMPLIRLIQKKTPSPRGRAFCLYNRQSDRQAAVAAFYFFAPQGLQGFFALQGLHGFFAAQGFFALQGLHGFFAAQGFFAFTDRKRRSERACRRKCRRQRPEARQCQRRVQQR